MNAGAEVKLKFQPLIYLAVLAEMRFILLFHSTKVCARL
jgi:hypothetical protein